jgi:peptide/nickel transport system ATP-binding protein
VFNGAGANALEVEGLCADYGQHRVVSDVSFWLRERECLALVGESGSGKTTVARCIVGLHGSGDGFVSYRGTRLPTRARDREPEARRRLQYIFQSPYNSLNPRQSVDDIVALPIRFFFAADRRDARQRAAALLERVGLPRSVVGRYPDELSGGERQRVAIARALAAEPDILICDEITSALDVSVQAAIIDLLSEMQRAEGLSMLFITHNLALVRNICDRVLIMNRGVVVEAGASETVLDQPQHQYTRALLSDTPSMFERAPTSPVG